MKSRIITHLRTGSDYLHLVMDAPEVAAQARPGQFLMIKLTTLQTDPLLRRPLSIMDAHPDGTVEILYKIAGRGTLLLSKWTVGTELDIIGPLGNGFLPSTTPQTAILVGGGIGIPPLIFLAHYLKETTDYPVHAFLGARTAADLPFFERFGDYGAGIHLATESGELGIQGIVTDPLIEFLDHHMPGNPVIYACGPDPMLKAVKKLSESRNISARLSLEEHMGCGIGACLGCVIETKSGYQRVCTDGPVFDADLIKKWK